MNADTGDARVHGGAGGTAQVCIDVVAGEGWYGVAAEYFVAKLAV